MPILSFWHWMAVAVIAMCAVTPWIAYLKNRPVFLWFALGMLTNPIAFVVLLCLPSRPRPPYRPPAAPGEMRVIE
jgi:hypothetical protein